MADAIVSVVLEQLISIIAKETEQEVRLVTGVEKEIEKLTSNFRAIQVVLRDADQRRMKKDEAVGYWLDRLKDASYDVDDILDEWNFAIFKLQMEGALAPKKKVCSFFPSPRFCFKQAGLRRDIALRIKEVNQNLDFIAKEKDMYNLVMNRSINEPKRSKTTSFVDVFEIQGRNEEKTDLVSKLVNDGSEKGKHPHVISIVGMGGIGKTTLAQLAYNNEKVIKKFDKRIWVCVSDTFDEIKVVKAIIECLTKDVCTYVELQSLLNYINELVAEKKFLLVLDDVWTEEYNWGPLYYCLNNGLHGSKILVTTRKESVSHMMKSFDIIKLGKLNEEESWSLFKQLAFSNRSEHECSKLEKIGKDIVDKCKGLPLAVKIVGSLLRLKNTEQQWQRILDNEFWNFEELNKSLFPLLFLSYNDLPLKEKYCFLYCAIFPKDYVMNKNELIQLWMAQGYLSLEQSEDLETIGQDCFENLVLRSFFQEFKKDLFGNIISSKMHDIVHDFAQSLVKNECFNMEINRLEAQSLNSPDVKARHLTLLLKIGDASFPFNISSVQKLRSLLIKDQSCKSELITDELPLLSDIFEKLTCLRTLELSRVRYAHFPDGYMNEMILKDVGKLIHLRYLNISCLQIREIPETVCDLYNLQTLNLDWCKLLHKLPQGMGKLINLRHLITSRCHGLGNMPKGVENLTRLRTLSWFVVGDDVEGSQVCSLGSLQNLKHLGGHLSLKRLGNVGNSAEAKRAQLNNKKNLRGLYMYFSGCIEASTPVSVIEKDEAVLEALQPPLNLERLYMEGYCGASFPEWMAWLTQLKYLRFSKCTKCEQLPALGKLPSLESIIIREMESIYSVGNEFLGVENATTSTSSSFIAFPKLKRLEIGNMRKWEVWDDENTRQITILPSLSALTIRDCPKLKALPEYILRVSSLKRCSILGCPKLGKLPLINSTL